MLTKISGALFRPFDVNNSYRQSSNNKNIHYATSGTDSVTFGSSISKNVEDILTLAFKKLEETPHKHIIHQFQGKSKDNIKVKILEMFPASEVVLIISNLSKNHNMHELYSLRKGYERPSKIISLYDHRVQTDYKVINHIKNVLNNLQD